MNVQEILEKLESGASGQDIDRLVYGGALEELEPDVRLGVLACAVPERFDTSLAQMLFSGPVGLNGNSGRAFEALSSLPFVHHRPSGNMEFSPEARSFFLLELKNSHNETLKEINEALVEYYGNEASDPTNRKKKNLSFQFLKAFHTANVDREKGFNEFDRLEARLPNQAAKDQANYSIFHLCKQWDHVYDYCKENYYYYEGVRLYHQGRKKEALGFLRPVADSDLINERVAIACHLVGRIMTSDYKARDKVEGYFQKSLNIGKEIDSKSVLVQVFHSLGILLGHISERFEDAENAFQESFDLRNSPNGKKQVLTSWATFKRERKLYHKAEEKIRECLETVKQLPYEDLKQKQMCFNELGHIRKALGRFEEAIGHYENALKIVKIKRFKSGIKRFIQDTRKERKIIRKEQARVLEFGGPVNKYLSPRHRLQVMCGILEGSNAMDELMTERKRERERYE